MIYYNSCDKKCKSVFGAVVKDENVTFTVFTDNCTECFLCIDNEEKKMEKKDNIFFCAYAEEKPVSRMLRTTHVACP